MLSCGHVTAIKIGEQAKARITIGRRVLYSVEKIKKYLTYMETREIAESTRVNYLSIWNNRVRDEIGDLKVVQILPSHIKLFYLRLSKAGYSHSMIKAIHIKVLQYIMGHASIEVTMQVYNHIGDLTRVEREFQKIDTIAMNFG